MPNYTAPTSDDRRIWDLWLSGTHQAAIVAADHAGIFESLDAGPASAEVIAQRLDFDIRATRILLRGLAALDLVVGWRGIYHLTDEARLYLLRSSPFYWGHMMRNGVSAWHRDTLLQKLKHTASIDSSGRQGVPEPQGLGSTADNWAVGRITRDKAHSIAASMHSHSLPAAIGAARNYDFTGIKRILDVGGGSGCFMIAFAQVHPHLKGTVMELPSMCEAASNYINAGGATGQVDTAALDMFRDPWPKGFDAVFFSNVWHDWNVETCTWLAQRAYEVLPSGGRIMLHEMLVSDDGASPATAAMFSLFMLLTTQGQQFTLLEIESILRNAGFRELESRQTAGYYSLITGYKP